MNIDSFFFFLGHVSAAGVRCFECIMETPKDDYCAVERLVCAFSGLEIIVIEFTLHS